MAKKMTLKNIKKLKLWLMEQNSLWDVDIDLSRNGKWTIVEKGKKTSSWGYEPFDKMYFQHLINAVNYGKMTKKEAVNEFVKVIKIGIFLINIRHREEE